MVGDEVDDGDVLRKAIANGDVSQATIDEKVTRVVYSLAKVGALDTPKPGNASTDVTSDAHRALARTLAAASATLIRNEPRSHGNGNGNGNGAAPLLLSPSQSACKPASPKPPLPMMSLSRRGMPLVRRIIRSVTMSTCNA